jgi:hypothetical protein
MFGERAEVAFLKGCADTSGKLPHPFSSEYHLLTRDSFVPAWSRCHCCLSGACHDWQHRGSSSRDDSVEGNPRKNA